MNKIELKQALDEERIDSHYYSLNGLSEEIYDNRVILENENSKWLVYYFEHGEKWDVSVFDTEDEACKFLFQWVIRDPNTRIWKEL